VKFEKNKIIIQHTSGELQKITTQTTPLLFSMCIILRDLLQQKNKPYGVMQGELPQFDMFPRSHGNISFLQKG
jgi:hypothetical protein